jgi:hypothetical protein
MMARVVKPQVKRCAILLFVAGVFVAGCGSPDIPDVLVVPSEHASVQEAVDNAKPGDLILIAPGTYNEAVRVDTDDLVIRGEERNTVIFDGQFALTDGFLVAANGVAIENLTVQNYTQNGIVFSGPFASQQRGSSEGYDSIYGVGDNVVDGYRVSYVTAANNGQYGVYAFAARNGVIEYSYASGHPDSGFYVGQCRPCNALLHNLTAEKNAIGYYGTNASGDVWVIESVFRANRLGIAPNSQDAERLAPQQQTVVAANLVIDNDDEDTPEIPMGLFGVGIAIGGGTENIVFRNRIVGHVSAGIVVSPLGRYAPENNRIEENILTQNTFDLVLRVDDATGAGNCFKDNMFAVSDPNQIEMLLGCDQIPRPWQAGPYTPVAAPEGRLVTQMPPPPLQDSMPNPRTAPAVAARGIPVFPALKDLRIPAELR